MDAEALTEEAFKRGKIGARLSGALKRHAAKHSPEHIRHMLSLMQHTTFRTAHKAAMATVGK